MHICIMCSKTEVRLTIRPFADTPNTIYELIFYTVRIASVCVCKVFQNM